MNATAPINLEKYLRLDNSTHKSVLYKNALLSTSLSFCIVVSFLATLLKLWIIQHERDVNPSGPLYIRLRKRQEAYNGSIVWRLEGCIASLPIMSFIALLFFGLFILCVIKYPLNIRHQTIHTHHCELALSYVKHIRLQLGLLSTLSSRQVSPMSSWRPALVRSFQTRPSDHRCRILSRSSFLILKFWSWSEGYPITFALFILFSPRWLRLVLLPILPWSPILPTSFWCTTPLWVCSP